jgi:hypothetical protein
MVGVIREEPTEGEHPYLSASGSPAAYGPGRNDACFAGAVPRRAGRDLPAQRPASGARVQFDAIATMQGLVDLDAAVDLDDLASMLSGHIDYSRGAGQASSRCSQPRQARTAGWACTVQDMNPDPWPEIEALAAARQIDLGPARVLVDTTRATLIIDAELAIGKTILDHLEAGRSIEESLGRAHQQVTPPRSGLTGIALRWMRSN